MTDVYAITLTSALNHSIDIEGRLKGLTEYLYSVKYLCLRHNEYENGLSNKYLLESQLEEVQSAAKEHEALYKTSANESDLAAYNFMYNVAQLLIHYTAIIRAEESLWDAETNSTESDCIHSIYEALIELITIHNGLGEASRDEISAFFALHGIGIKT